MKSSRFCLMLFLGLASLVTSKVVSLNSNNFDELIADVPISIVKFYAPWCGHCKSLAPKYEAAGAAMLGLRVPFFELDASDDENRPISNRYGIASYPTMKIFKSGKIDEAASADLAKVARETRPLINFMSELSGHDPPNPPRRDEPRIDPKDDPCAGPTADAYAKEHYGDCCGNGNWEKPEHLPVCRRLQEIRRQNTPLPEVHVEKASESAVLVIKDMADFDEVAPRHHLMLIEWFAPWCGHCKEFAPIYRKVSIPLRRYGVTLAKMDGTDPKSQPLKQRFNVEGFPTIKLLWWGEVDERLSYAVSMIRGEDDFMSFLKLVKDGGEPEMPDDPDLPPPMVRKGGDRREMPKPKPKPKPSTAEPKGSKVVQLKGKTDFDTVLSRSRVALVEFYAPWCGHCKKLTPEYTKAAAELVGDRILLAKVDATDEKNSAMKEEYGIRSFPTLKIFIGGKFSQDYDGGRTSADIVRTMRAQNDHKPPRKTDPRRSRVPSPREERRRPASKKDDPCLDVDYTLKNYAGCCSHGHSIDAGHSGPCVAAKTRMMKEL